MPKNGPKQRNAAPINAAARGSQHAATKTPAGADDWLLDFIAACECFGARAIATALSYATDTQVRLTCRGSAAPTPALQARWQAATSRGYIRDLTLRTRKVNRRGIKWGGEWLTAPAIRSRIGLQVAVRGDGRGRLIVFEGALLAPICTLQPIH